MGRGGVYSSAGAGGAAESLFGSSGKKPEMAGSLKPHQLPMNAIVVSRSEVARIKERSVVRSVKDEIVQRSSIVSNSSTNLSFVHQNKITLENYYYYHVLVTATFAWSFSLNRSSPGSSKRSSGALSATLTF